MLLILLILSLSVVLLSTPNLLGQPNRFYRRRDLPFQLSFADGIEDLLEERALLPAEGEKVVPGQDRRRVQFLTTALPQHPLAELDVLGRPAAGHRVGPVQGEQLADARVDEDR